MEARLLGMRTPTVALQHGKGPIYNTTGWHPRQVILDRPDFRENYHSAFDSHFKMTGPKSLGLLYRRNGMLEV